MKNREKRVRRNLTIKRRHFKYGKFFSVKRNRRKTNNRTPTK